MQNLSRAITAADDLSRILAKSDDNHQILFKHSIACAVSSNAFTEIQDFLDHPQFHMLVVQDQPQLKMVVQELLDVKHESPQVIVIKDRKAIQVFNHHTIQHDAIAKYLN